MTLSFKWPAFWLVPAAEESGSAHEHIGSFVTRPGEKVVQGSRGVTLNQNTWGYIQMLCAITGWHFQDFFSNRTHSCLLSTMIAYILFTALAVLPLLLYLRNPYISRDLAYTFTSLQIGYKLAKYAKHKPFYSILDCFLDKAAKQPNKKFILFEDSSFTYSQADKESNRVARALSTHAHLKEGDTVALFMGNEPQLVWLWLALAKLGCTASMLNCNIRSKSLLHCFSCCDAKTLVASAGRRR